jgi:four helix bundle protein
MDMFLKSEFRNQIEKAEIILIIGCDILRISVLISMGSDLQKRLIRFVGLCLQVKKSLLNCYECEHLAKQLVRSSTSAALNFGEARSAESRKDFIHKQSIILKELRESHINIMILEDNRLGKDPALLERALDENDQLIRIFVVSINKAKSRNLK